MSAQQLMDRMRRTNITQLMHLASDNSGVEGGYIRVARVIRDGYVIPKESMLTLFRNPSQYNSVPLITGTNRDEQKVFMVRDPAYVETKWGVIPRIRDSRRYHAISDYISQNWKAGAVDEPSKIITAHKGQAVYAYRFDWDDMLSNSFIDLPALLGAAHGMEINYVFGDFIGATPFQITYSRQNHAGRKQLAEQMMSYWAQFAYSGSPGRGRKGDLPEWTSWQSQGPNLMLFDELNDGGTRMAEIRTHVVDIKQQLAEDTVLSSPKDKCRAYATLFLHGYQTSDFYQADEYLSLGCERFPVGSFR
jgi:para-nitrobenzyl esterase